MKRKMHNALVLMIVLILSVLVVGGVFLYMSDKTGNDVGVPKESDNNTKGEVKFLNSKKDESIITQLYKAYLNEKNIDIVIRFEYEIQNYQPEENSSYNRQEIVRGIFNDIILFEYRKDSNATTQRPDMFDTVKIDKVFGINFFKVIRGTDGKDYVAIATKFDDLEVPTANYLYVFNDELELISNIFEDSLTCQNSKQTFVIHPADKGLLIDENIWYENQFNYTNYGKRNTLVKVESDRIMYLYEDIDYVDGNNFGNLLEQSCTIDNDKIDCKTEKTYKAAGIFGNSC